MRVPSGDSTKPRRIREALIVAGAAACAALAPLAVPALANARRGFVVFPGSHEVALSIKASHGYSVEVTRTNRFVELAVTKGPDLAMYLIRHRQAKNDGLDAEFPGVGRVSVKFHAVGQPDQEAGFFPPCKGGETVKQPGYFQGTIRFRGERGYTSVHADRAQGDVVTTAREICKRSTFDPSKPEPAEERTSLFASSAPQHGRSVAFFASTVKSGPSGVTFFTAYARERRRGMSIFRETLKTGAAKDLAPGDTGDYPASATVTPPAPFHGSAAFERNPGGENSWTGSLGVDLPGLGRVALAGPSFSAKLCRDSGCRSPRYQSAFGRRLIHGRVPAGLG